LKIQYPNLIINTDQSPFFYALKLCFPIFATGLGIITMMYLFDYQENVENIDAELTLSGIFRAVFLAPFIETFLMILVIAVIKKVFREKLYIGLTSGIIWACLHSLINPLWGLGVFILFFVMSLAYLFWEDKSTIEAIKVVFFIHTLNNGLVVLLAFVSDLFN
jgi:hypothetical protein